MDMIGNSLYTERRKKGLEIPDVEQATGIRGIYLQALEQGKYEVLPGEVYVKGFIRNYGNFLGLDGAHLVQLYSESVTPTPVPGNAAAAPAPSSASKSLDSMRRHPFSQKMTSKKTISTLAIVLLLIVSAASLYVWQKSSVTQAPAPSRNALATKSKPAAAPTSPSVNSTSGGVSAMNPAGSRPVILVARYSDRCWTSVIADGKTLYEGIPRIGETFTWEADRQIVINFGNAAAVDLTFNGQPVGKIGEKGDVVVRTFTARGSISPTSPAVPGVSGSRP